MIASHPVFERLRIFAPGPTPVPEAVLGMLARSPLHHRTTEFIAILERTLENLKFLFQTKEPAYLLSASGTGAMEATIVNLFSPHDEVLVVNGGKFGERWVKIAQAFQLKVHVIDVKWGDAVDPSAIETLLKSNPKIRAVLFQASETSTGVYHPVKEIAAIVHQNSDALVVVDAITALGVCPLPMDAWGLDAVISGSQKALMLPPGLAFLSLSSKARSQRKNAIPRFYYNLEAEDKALKSGETAWTPAVGLIMALDIVLARLKEAGLDSVFAHHAKLAKATRLGVEALGLELFAKKSPSDALTAIHVPASIPEGKKIISYLRDRFGITVAGGQDQFKGKMVRIAHLGYFDELDMLTMLSAFEMTLSHLGHRCELGSGVRAAQMSFMKDAARV